MLTATKQTVKSNKRQLDKPKDDNKEPSEKQPESTQQNLNEILKQTLQNLENDDSTISAPQTNKNAGKGPIAKVE